MRLPPHWMRRRRSGVPTSEQQTAKNKLTDNTLFWSTLHHGSL